MRRLTHPGVMVALVFVASVLVFFWDVLFAGKVLLPLDNLWLYSPWDSFAAQFGATVPHNHLLADAVLENIVWKSLARDSVLSGVFPLWNPYVFAGMPFMATGQPAALYPLGALFYLLPLLPAYAWFTALHMLLGGAFTCIYMRVIKVGWLGTMVAGLAFIFSGFVIVSLLWPMVISTVIWLPLILAMLELVIREFEARAKSAKSGETAPGNRTRIIIWALIAAIAVGMQFLAGHMEFSFYILFTALFYALWRLGIMLWQTRHCASVIGAGLVLGGVMALGAGLAAIQLIPFAEVGSLNFRGAMVSYEDVTGWALPKKRLLSFIIPDFFGNPSQHTYFDFSSLRMESLAHTFNDRVVHFAADWDVKNFVEGASYVGILPLLLGLLAVVFRRGRYALIFAAYAVWALLLAFGTPALKVFFYGIPGFDQLHTPFRWIFPYTVSVVFLAGLGADWLSRQAASRFRQWRRAYTVVTVLVSLAGLGILAALGGGLFLKDRLLAVADGMVQGSEKLQESFGSGQVFFHFEFGNVLALALLALGGALVLWLARLGLKLPTKWGGYAVWQPLAVVILLVDLFFFGYDFNARSTTEALDFTPPAVQAIQQDDGLYRIASYGHPEVLAPNTPQLFGLQDMRGYDSVIPRQYVEYWKLIEPPQGLLYNRLHKLVEPESLDSKFLDLLNVKYVLTKENIDRPSYTEVYRGEINVYRNDDCMPRAFVAPEGRIVANSEEALAELSRADFDPRRIVVLEEVDKAQSAEAAEREHSPSPISAEMVDITSYTHNEVHISVHTGRSGYLVLADSYFPGWQVSVNGQEAPLYKADYNFRAVPVNPGANEIIFKYSPMSFKLGGFFSFISGMILLLALALLLSRRFLPKFEGSGTLGRVTKNSLTPMAASFLNKGIDIVFAMLMLRMLGPMDAGKYYFAIVVIGYFEILTNFGLNTLLTREVAKDPSSSNRYLSNTAILRLILLLISAPLIFAVVIFWQRFYALDANTVLAIALLAIALVPSNISAALSSLFYAYEKMEYPAVVTIITTLLKVTIGVVVLVLGYSFVGLAATSIVVNIITMLVFVYLVVTRLFRPKLEFDPSFGKNVMGTSLPLMLNHFLATVFFRCDIMMLQPMRGDTAVGYYSTAYKFIDGLNIIPSTFTFAIFPILSRYADSAQDALLRAYTISLRALIMISLPIAVGTMFLAEPIILFFGGEEFVPHSVLALQVLIWFLPFSYINGVTQYVLIAVNQQRFITVGFVLAASFNILANLVMIPLYGFVGAAIVTIFSELALLVPFLYCVRRHVGVISLPAMMVKPALATAVMGLVIWQLQALNPFIVLAVGVLVYVVALLALRTFNEEERTVFRRLLARG